MQLSLSYEVFRCIHGIPWITGYIASWLILGLSLISKFLVASIAIYLITAASDWPCLFLHPGCFCLALNLRSPGRIPLVTDDVLGAEGFDWDSTATAGLSFWLTIEETFNVLDWFDNCEILITRDFNSTSSCFTLSPIDFCFSSISLKNFKASLTLGLQTLQKNMMLANRSPLRTSCSSLEIPTQTRCSHLRQDSHSILSSSTFLLHLTQTTTSPDLSLVFFVDGESPPPALSCFDIQ